MNPSSYWTTKKVEEVAQDLYGIKAIATPLQGYEDINFRLDTGKAKNRYSIFKVISEDTESESVECQHAVLGHLKKKLKTKFKGVGPIASKSQKEIESHGGYRIRVLNFVEGTIMSEIRRPRLDLYYQLGESLGDIDQSLQDFSHPCLVREIEWDLVNFPLKESNLKYVDDAEVRDSIRLFLQSFQSFVETDYNSLRKSAIHNDVNDHNVVLGGAAPLPSSIEAIIDYGDLIYQALVFDPAIAIAYAIMDSDEPLTIAATFIKGYVSKCPLQENELSQIYTLVGSRLSHSLLMSAEKKYSDPDNEYFQISDQQAANAIKKWSALPESYVSSVLKSVAGIDFLVETDAVLQWIDENKEEFRPVLLNPGELANFPILDFSVTSRLSEDPKAIHDIDVKQNAIGRYLEPRLVYQGDNFKDEGGRRNIHLGIDLFAAAGSKVFVPCEGVVFAVTNNALQYDYGPTIIIEHKPEEGIRFWTLYGHLNKASLKRFKVGQKVEAGFQIGNLGDRKVNGNWSPHLHFQLITDIWDTKGNFPGVANAKFIDVWKKISPNPASLLGLDPDLVEYDLGDVDELLQKRTKRLGAALSISYTDPLKIVRGFGAYLYSETGEEYLDCVNNVCHVGHSNPTIVEALYSQASLLNTNTRYLHDNIVNLSERLTATLPKSLEVCFFVNSGSEANDLALRLAKAATGNTDFVVLDSGYHGHTESLIGLSPYKFNGKGGSGKPINTQVLPLPDTYRGLYREDHSDPGRAYANHVDEALAEIKNSKGDLAGFIGETILSCGGQIDPPAGFLKEVYGKIRKAGGVCIADEVQTGFARVGDSFWAFESQGVIPDIVTMGKPMGNGHPLAAVVTTKKIADKFANGMEYFNTFGGNPVSCAVGLAVLDFIEDNQLQENARELGTYFKDELKSLQNHVDQIGDVRGQGLFLGVEFVTDRESREPNPELASDVVEAMKERNILLSTDGPQYNVIKIKPPLVFSRDDVDRVIQSLKLVLNLEDQITISESELETDEVLGEENVHIADVDMPIDYEETSEFRKDKFIDNPPNETESVVREPETNTARESWYGEFKADVVGFDTKVKNYGKKSSSKNRGLKKRIKKILRKDKR